MAPPVPPQTRQYQRWAAPVMAIANPVVWGPWLVPLETPPAHLLEPGLSAAYTQYHTGFTVPAATTTVSLDWATPLSEPVRTEPGLSAAWTQYHTGFTVPAAVTDLRNYWHLPLAEPVRIKQGLRAANQQEIFKAVAPWCTSSEIFNSADKSATIVLYDNSLTARKVSSDGNYANARGTISRTAGKVYFEVLTANFLDPNADIGIGIANSSQPLDGVGNTNWIGDVSANGLGYYYGESPPASGTSLLYIKNVATAFPFTTVASDNIGFAINFDTKSLWIRKNGGAWFGSGGGAGDPVTGVNGLSFAGLNSGPWFPATSLFKIDESATVQTYTPYSYTVPSGYGNWQDGDPPTSLGWYDKLTEPVRFKKSISWQQFLAIDAKYQPSALQWYQRFSEPVRTKVDIRWREPFVTDGKWSAPTVTVYSPLSEPVRVRPSLHAARQQFFAIDTKVAPSVSSWLLPFAEPVRAKSDIRYREPFVTDSKPPTQVQYWWSALSEPVRIEPGLSAAWTQYHTGFTVPAVTTTYNWFSPLSEPVMQEGGLGAPYQQVSSVGTGIAFYQYDFTPFSEPVRTEPGLGAAWTQYHTGFVVPAAAAATDIKAYQPLSEPVRVRARVAWQQPFTMDWRWTPPSVTDLRNYWYQPFSEPVRSKKAVAWQQFFAANTNYIYADSWWRPLAEPVRTKKTIPWQQFFATDLSLLTDLRVYWYRPLSEPVRVKPAVVWQQFFVTDPTTPSAVTDLRNFWFQPWSEPVRSKKPVAWQQYFVTDPTTPAAVTDLRNFWYQPLAEPVRSKKSVPWQRFTTNDPPFVITDLRNYWYQPLAEPVRFKRSVPWQLPWVMDWKWGPPANPLFTGWYRRLEEPVRERQGLHAARQQFFTTDWKWSPPTASLLPGWHRWLSEPVRQKPGIHASRVPFFQMDWKWSPPFQAIITYTLNATEQGDSGQFFYSGMDIVLGAYVTITEEQIGNMAVVTLSERRVRETPVGMTETEVNLTAVTITARSE